MTEDEGRERSLSDSGFSVMLNEVKHLYEIALLYSEMLPYDQHDMDFNDNQRKALSC